MRKYFPIVVSLVIVAVLGYITVHKKNEAPQVKPAKRTDAYTIGRFNMQKKCANPPHFLTELKIPQPVVIDLSQKQFKGIALLYGKQFQKALHPKQWEQYGHLSTYTLDKQGNIYLVPMPFISILPTTFNLQKNLYRVDSTTGKLSVLMQFDDVHPSASNPYGLNALVYDCEDETLWAAAIDESDYRTQKGVLYHIDPKNHRVLQQVEGFDALSLALLKNYQGRKFLLAGSARDNGLYAYEITQGKLAEKPVKVLELPSVNEHIRKIKIKGNNTLELQVIPFSYTLIAQTANSERMFYQAVWHEDTHQWKLIKK
jgi:hypothetical protein